MSDAFGFSQANDGTTQLARISVPGCGRKERDDAPVILIEKDRISGEIYLFVYADILSDEPTHEIPLGGAKLEAKK